MGHLGSGVQPCRRRMGIPKRIWDKRTGEIDHSVAEYWREHYDLRYIMERDWKTLGPKLQGKVHIYCGDMDTFYLNNAVYLMEDFLKNTKDPHYEGEVDYGDRAEHCWNGDHTRPIAILTAAVSSDVHPARGEADSGVCARRRGCEIVEVLS